MKVTLNALRCRGRDPSGSNFLLGRRHMAGDSCEPSPACSYQSSREWLGVPSVGASASLDWWSWWRTEIVLSAAAQAG